MNRRDKMHPNKARRDSPEMGLAFLDGERVVAPRRAIRWPAARNEHLDALREVADSGRYYRVSRPVVAGMELSPEKLSTLQQPSAEHEASIGLDLTKALLATKHEPERMHQITWSLSKSERVFDCAGGDSDNGETIATDGQVEALANRGYIKSADAYNRLIDRNNLREIRQVVDIGPARHPVAALCLWH
ncbi:hypothetical protein [Rhizobium indigoferae]|uniref:Uncharacterized protein n=1 Tax=Rhizobium indigoferae TaxID=158891 RepID=A0ABZ1DR57_9HYPH|nr:hypothetical protein [Rhizobium indigoferae]NNU57291.1 hypothetical protein [Rhizobium indigoferae]WRW37644.1 hypothetical protein U5G49_007247 [Rhizobium indigoferae]GLR58196.1 hypothetical protein GCM10007919_29210 [Rhizobium indigoferae]